MMVIASASPPQSDLLRYLTRFAALAMMVSNKFCTQLLRILRLTELDHVDDRRVNLMKGHLY